MVTIELNTEHPLFAGQDTSKTRLILGPTLGTSFYPFSKPSFAKKPSELGESGTTNRRLEVTGKRKIEFTDEAFKFLGNVTHEGYQATITKGALLGFMEKGLIIIKHDGVELSAEDVAEFPPTPEEEPAP